jgi:hypothetical protein
MSWVRICATSDSIGDSMEDVLKINVSSIFHNAAVTSSIESPILLRCIATDDLLYISYSI